MRIHEECIEEERRRERLRLGDSEYDMESANSYANMATGDDNRTTPIIATDIISDRESGITQDLGHSDDSESDSNPATPEGGPTDGEATVNDRTASVELPATYDQIMTIQGFTKNANGSRTHLESIPVKLAIGNVISRSRTRPTLTEILTKILEFRENARIEFADNQGLDSAAARIEFADNHGPNSNTSTLGLSEPEEYADIEEVVRHNGVNSDNHDDGGTNGLVPPKFRYDSTNLVPPRVPPKFRCSPLNS
jgi:hypothetical protein